MMMGKRPFVLPSEYAAVLHRPPSTAYTFCAQDKDSTAMEAAALKTSSRPELLPQNNLAASADDAAWPGFAEKGNFLADGFVDELLNLGDFNEEADDFEGEDAAESPKSPPLRDSNSQETPAAAPQAPLAGISLPSHDAADLEWVADFIDDSLSEFPTIPTMKKANNCTLTPKVPVPVRAKRTKRRRTAAPWSSSSALTSFTDSSSAASPCSSASSSAFSDLQTSSLFDAAPPTRRHSAKKRGRKPKQHSFLTGASSGVVSGAGERRCSHCGVSKTPQWRAGPEGAKTLCNACGVRFKSGRLLPEYRPACSPTFESSIHSNSHRKVLEMRRKKEAELSPATAVASF